jgi:hypothetical protein
MRPLRRVSPVKQAKKQGSAFRASNFISRADLPLPSDLIEQEKRIRESIA